MANPDELTSDVNFLFEMGNIRFIQRMWTRFAGSNFANLAEHHFRVFWIAMVIAQKEGADTGKVAKMALAHDIAESRTGDVDYLSRQYVERHEKLAITDMLDGTSLENEFYSLWEEYEARQSLEAKIVKDADNIDIDFELAEQAANGDSLQRVKKPSRDFVIDHKLYTKTAKDLARQMQNTNPQDWWWQSSRNRRNGGDWQK